MKIYELIWNKKRSFLLFIFKLHNKITKKTIFSNFRFLKHLFKVFNVFVTTTTTKCRTKQKKNYKFYSLDVDKRNSCTVTSVVL